MDARRAISGAALFVVLTPCAFFLLLGFITAFGMGVGGLVMATGLTTVVVAVPVWLHGRARLHGYRQLAGSLAVVGLLAAGALMYTLEGLSA